MGIFEQRLSAMSKVVGHLTLTLSVNVYLIYDLIKGGHV